MWKLRSICSHGSSTLKAVLPAEWGTWAEVAKGMSRFRNPSESERRRNRFVLVWIFAVGAVPASLAAPTVMNFTEGALGAIFGGLLAFFGLLVGFLVTLMLFTGRLGTVSSLSVEELRSYGSRLRYLLVSQSVTLACAMSGAALCILYLVVFFAKAPLLMHSITLSALGGVLMLCAFRSLLLPIQIFELHDAHLDDELTAKSVESNRKYE